MLKVFLFGDVHSPYEDSRAVKLAMKAASYIKPDVLVDVGDSVDCYAISRHDKDPDRLGEKRFVDEIKHAKQIREKWDRLKVEKKIKILGNHEDRLRRYMWTNAPHLVGYAPTIEDGLECKENGWEVIQYKNHTWIGKLLVTHDIGRCGVYAVRQSLIDAGCSIVFGHTHRLVYRIEGSGTGKRRVGATVGWLGDFWKVDYDHRWKVASNWMLGFAYALVDERSGLAYLTAVPIIDYKCYIGTKEIKG